jgi:CheY-like chemotaxis protein
MALGRQRLRVLVVDDHEDSRTMLRLLLEQTGHEAIEAVDGIDGVQLALSRRPDVAIVDIGLPGINGYEVARRLRQLPRSRPIALIALTGYGQDEDRRRALQVGFDRHLVKPVDAERLKLALIEVTRSQPANEE